MIEDQLIGIESEIETEKRLIKEIKEDLKVANKEVDNLTPKDWLYMRSHIRGLNSELKGKRNLVDMRQRDMKEIQKFYREKIADMKKKAPSIIANLGKVKFDSAQQEELKKKIIKAYKEDSFENDNQFAGHIKMADDLLKIKEKQKMKKL